MTIPISVRGHRFIETPTPPPPSHHHHHLHHHLRPVYYIIYLRLEHGCVISSMFFIDGLVQDCNNFSALAMEFKCCSLAQSHRYDSANWLLVRHWCAVTYHRTFWDVMGIRMLIISVGQIRNPMGRVKYQPTNNAISLGKSKYDMK